MFSWETYEFLKQQKQPPKVFRKKHLQLYKNRLQSQVFSYENCESFQNNYFEEHLSTNAS